MANVRPSDAQQLKPSVLDRLIDDHPELSTDIPRSTSQSLRDLKRAVCRDLENLLNTRWRPSTWPESLDQLDDSLVNYGIPDFTGPELAAAVDPVQLLRAIEQAIRTFEPRMRRVRVELAGGGGRGDRALRFRIDATLYVHPYEDQVSFTSALETSSGSFSVSGDSA